MTHKKAKSAWSGYAGKMNFQIQWSRENSLTNQRKLRRKKNDGSKSKKIGGRGKGQNCTGAQNILRAIWYEYPTWFQEGIIIMIIHVIYILFTKSFYSTLRVMSWLLSSVQISCQTCSAWLISFFKDKENSHSVSFTLLHNHVVFMTLSLWRKLNTTGQLTLWQ